MNLCVRRISPLLCFNETAGKLGRATNKQKLSNQKGKKKAEISEQEITFLDTSVYKGLWFNTVSILDVKTHFKPTETFHYTEFTSCHPPGVKKGFIKEEALRLLRANSSIFNFQENTAKFKRNLIERDYPERLIQETLSEVKFDGPMGQWNSQSTGLGFSGFYWKQ